MLRAVEQTKIILSFAKSVMVIKKKLHFLIYFKKIYRNFFLLFFLTGYIRDLEQLRNHMQFIHKVKIHPKMIYNRPPLNCQKCQFRFFTDQVIYFSIMRKVVLWYFFTSETSEKIHNYSTFQVKISV